MKWRSALGLDRITGAFGSGWDLVIRLRSRLIAPSGPRRPPAFVLEGIRGCSVRVLLWPRRATATSGLPLGVMYKIALRAETQHETTLCKFFHVGRFRYRSFPVATVTTSWRPGAVFTSLFVSADRTAHAHRNPPPGQTIRARRFGRRDRARRQTTRQPQHEGWSGVIDPRGAGTAPGNSRFVRSHPSDHPRSAEIPAESDPAASS